MSIRNYGRNAVATTVLATTALLGVGVAPQALAETATPSIEDQLKVCVANTNVAVAIDLAADENDFEVQKEAVAKLIAALKSGNTTALSLITVDGDKTETRAFNLPEQTDEALKFVADLQATHSGKPAVWDKVLTAAHGIEGLNAVAVFSGDRIDASFDAPASVLRGAGVAVVPVAIASASSDAEAKPSEQAPATSEKADEKETKSSESKPTKEETKPTKDQAKPSASKPTKQESKPTKQESKPTKQESKPSASKPTKEQSKPSVSKPTKEQSKPTTAAPAPKPSKPATPPTTQNPAPTTAAPAPSQPSNPAPSKPGGGLGDLVGDLANGGGKDLLNKGKGLLDNFTKGGGVGDIVNKGSKLLGDLFKGGGGLPDFGGMIKDFGKNFLNGSATTAALAGSTDPAVVLENAKATGLIDANGNWDANAISAQLVERGLADENGVINAAAIAEALDAPQIVEADGTVNTEEVANLFADKDLSPLLGAGETSSIGLVNASAVTLPGVDTETANAVLDTTLAGTNVEAVIDSEQGDTGVKAIVVAAAVEAKAEAENITIQEAADQVVAEAGMAEEVETETLKDEGEKTLPDAKDHVYVATAEEAYQAIGTAFGKACDTEIVEAPVEKKKEEARPVLASTGANVAALAGFGLLSALGAGFVIARRNK